MDVLSCTTLHKGRLKGTNWKVNLYRPIDEPTSTTGMAVERLVLQACHRRLQLDRDVATEERVVFTHVELDDDNATATLEELEAQSVELYRRLLARDPLTIEVEAMVAHHNTITDIGGTNADWARMSCFAIGTTTEALFY